MTRTITSFANPLIKQIRALQDKTERKKTGQFLLEGLQAIGMAFERGIMPAMILTSGKTHHPLLAKILNAMPANSIIETTDAILGKISSRDNPQTVIAVYQQRWLPLQGVTPQGVWVVLDTIKDPGNLGTIIRTADAAGAAGVILLGETCDPYSVESVRATMGSIFALPLVRASQPDFLAWHTNWRGETVATTLADATDYRTPQYKTPLLLLMGNEQKGLPDSLVNIATHKVKLPMRGGAESLNVAVATAIMVYELYDVM